MKTCLVLFVVALVVASVPAMAARVASVPIEHPPILVYQAYPGDSNETNVAFLGYGGTNGDVISSVPGILSIIPGTNWCNFIGACRAQVPYTIKNVVLKKVTPEIVQCADVFPVKSVPQQGTPNIRLWWPLMYEVPGTCWTLTILYGTPIAWDDDGPTGPNPPAYVHTEVWTWCVDATIASMKNALELFHELPFGLDEVPLVSDELLYPILQAKLSAVQAALDAGDTVTAGFILGDFDMEVMDRCISVSPLSPNPTGPGTGIAFTPENPACCKLLADAEFVGKKYGIFVPSK